MNITKNEDGQIVQSGNVTRYVHGAPVPEVTHTDPEPNRVHSGALRYTEGAGVQSVGVTRYQAGQEPVRPNSVAATLRRDGALVSVEIEPGNQASRTSVETALRLGLLRPAAGGGFEDVGQPQQAPQQDQQQGDQKAPEVEQVFDQQEASVWAEEIEPLSQGSYDAAVAGTIAAVASGSEGFEGIASRLAEANGLEPERAREFVETGVEWYQRTLTNDLVKQGLCTADTVDQFYESLQGNPKLTQALQQFAIEGRTDTFRELARDFKRQSSLRTEAQMRDQFTRVGMKTMVDRTTGELLVQSGSGPWMPLSKLR